MFPAKSRQETLAEAILKATAAQKYKSSSVLAALGDPAKFQHHHFHALNEAFASALAKGNDDQALRIAAVLFFSLGKETPIPDATRALWCEEFMGAVTKGMPQNKGFAQQALLLGKLSHLARACHLGGLAIQLEYDIPTYVELAIEQGVQAGASSLNAALALLSGPAFNIRAGLMRVLRSSIERKDVAAAFLVTDKFLEGLSEDETARQEAFLRQFTELAATCTPPLQIELLEGASRLAIQYGLGALAEAFSQEAEAASEGHWHWTGQLLDIEIRRAVLYSILDTIKAHNAEATLERQIRAMGAALQRCLERSAGWEDDTAEKAEVILTVLVDLLSKFPLDMGALLYRLLDESTGHWTDIERAELQSAVLAIASDRGITVNLA